MNADVNSDRTDGGSESPGDPVWLRIERLSPRARRELDRIVAGALALADRDGLEALSMRSLAAALDTGTTTLYRYLRGREELIELMADMAYAMIDVPQGPSGDWRADLSSIARDGRRLYLDHPWLATTMVTIGPNTLRVADYASAVALAMTPSVGTAEAIMSSVVQFVRGAAIDELSERLAHQRRAMTHEQWRADIEPWVRAALGGGRYPSFARVAQSQEDLGYEEKFEFGLARLLDGVESFSAQRGERRDDGTRDAP